MLDGDHRVTLKGRHELALNADGKLKAKGFDKDDYAKSDDLYRWSSLRSDYLAEANVNTAQTYLVNGWYGPGWIGAGWYWSPWFDSFTFLPGAGYLYSPFGWGFYSPLWVSAAPWYEFGPYRHSFARFHPNPVYRGGLRAGVESGPVYGPGFRGGAVRAYASHSSAHGVNGFGGGVHGGFSAPAHTARSFGGFHAGGFHPGNVGGRR